jgi:hypothetical protein
LYKIQVFSAEVCDLVIVILEQKYQSDSLTKVTEVAHAQMLCQYWRWSQRKDETVTMQVQKYAEERDLYLRQWRS